MDAAKVKTPAGFALADGAIAAAVAIVTLVAIPGFGAAAPAGREREDQTAEVRIATGRAACTVELDAASAGKTDAQGRIVIPDVDPTDHYVHVRCPDDPQDTGYFISPRAGQKLEIRHGTASPSDSARTESTADAALDAAEAKIKLRELVKDAVQLRGKGQFDEAVQELREATKMDPENSDLHRELGITFLLNKDWKRARVEMLEAIRHDPTDADAHNGLGYALEKLGQMEPALKEYRRATQLEPDDLSYQQHYLEALSRSASQKPEKQK